MSFAAGQGGSSGAPGFPARRWHGHPKPLFAAQYFQRYIFLPKRVLFYVSFANNRSGQKLLCCNTFISVMETTELWNCDNLSNPQCLSRERTLLAEAQVGSRFMVVAEIRR